MKLKGARSPGGGDVCGRGRAQAASEKSGVCGVWICGPRALVPPFVDTTTTDVLGDA